MYQLTANVMGPRSLLQREYIVSRPSYIQTLINEYYVPPLRLVRARIKLNHPHDDLWWYNEHAGRPRYPANGIDASTHIALYSALELCCLYS